MVTPDAGEMAGAAMLCGGRSGKQVLLQLRRHRGALGAGCTQRGFPEAARGGLRPESQARGAITRDRVRQPHLARLACALHPPAARRAVTCLSDTGLLGSP